MPSNVGATQWRVEVETLPGVVWDESTCSRVLEGLADGGAIEPECVSDGAATYVVEAASFEQALRDGPSIWLVALQQAGVEPSINLYFQRPRGHEPNLWPPRDEPQP
jgi:hypothetical protein